MSPASEEFTVPSDSEILEILGVVTDAEDGEETVRVMRFSAEGEEMKISYDVIGRSVRVQLAKGDRVLVDLFREEMSQISVGRTRGAAEISAFSDIGELRFSLVVRVEPSFAVSDRITIR
jgi:hypothetical protein